MEPVGRCGDEETELLGSGQRFSTIDGESGFGVCVTRYITTEWIEWTEEHGDECSGIHLEELLEESGCQEGERDG